MRAIVIIFLLAGCTLRPLTAEEISIVDDPCPQELFLAGECDKPPLESTSIVD